MSDLYTTKTAALKAIKADVSKLNTKSLKVNGKDILEHIKESVPTIKHSQDTRETVTENDLWGQYIETKSDGTIIVHDDWVTNPSGSSAWNSSIVKVEDNKAYTGEVDYYGNLSNLAFCANIQTNKIKNGDGMFNNCTALATFSSDLPSLMNGDSMFYNAYLTLFSSDLSSLELGQYMFSRSLLTSFSSELPNLMNGLEMFYNCPNLTSFSSDLSSLADGYRMFYQCYNLKSFTSVLSSLMNGDSMFNWCDNLTLFSSDLPNLTSGKGMFGNCTKLISFNADLSSLSYGYQMFYQCYNLKSFTSVLSSLMNGYQMFQDCSNLSSFNVDLSSLMNGAQMFYNCRNLTSFNADLSSLMNGDSMFDRCKLDAESVMYIAVSIKEITSEKQLYTSGSIPYVTLSNGVYSNTKGFMNDGNYVYTYKNPQPYTTTISASKVGKLTLGINVTNNSSTIKQQLEDFAKAATFDSWEDLKQVFVDKGWTVTFQYGGTTTNITYDMRGERAIPCPIYTQLVEEEDKDRAEYCNEEGTKFYNIDWGHDVTNIDDYSQFDSIEDAMRAFNVFPKENIIVTEE